MGNSSETGRQGGGAGGTLVAGMVLGALIVFVGMKAANTPEPSFQVSSGIGGPVVKTDTRTGETWFLVREGDRAGEWMSQDEVTRKRDEAKRTREWFKKQYPGGWQQFSEEQKKKEATGE